MFSILQKMTPNATQEPALRWRLFHSPTEESWKSAIPKYLLTVKVE